jgi:LacI family transcriptional regulator
MKELFMRVTVRDVAREAGVSNGTVSRVLNQAEGVDGNLRRRVLEAVRTLGYVPPQQRSRDTARQAGAIGFVLMMREVDERSDRIGTFWSVILHGAEEHVSSRGGHVIFRRLHERDNPAQTVAQVARLGLKSALLVGPAPAPFVRAMQAAGIRIVLVDNAIDESGYVTVLSDNFQGALKATDHLLDLGHRDIAFIGGPPAEERPGTNSIYSIHWRALGYRTALRERGVAVRPELSENCDLSPQGGAEAMRRLLSAGVPFTGIVCANDPTAVGAMTALHDAGVAVPGQVSVVGFDDDTAVSTVPPLTTIRVRREAMGAVAARALLEEQAGPPVTIVVPVDLVVRESAAPPDAR